MITTRVVLETPRLLLREFSVHDATGLYLLNLDPDVMRYTGDQPFESPDAAALFVKAYDHYELYGFGRWTVLEKHTGEFLGWCGLKYTPSLNEYDVGFRFLRKYWNQGFATESAAACLRNGFSAFKMPVIVGRAMAANLPSIRVLIKIGMEYQEQRTCGGEDGVIYRKLADQL